MICEKYNITLESVVKAAAIDLGEDYTKVAPTFRHWVVRGLDILSNQTLNLGKRRELVKINFNTKSIPIPLDSRRITYVGFIDDCGKKEHLIQDVNIVGNIQPNELTKCEKCGECTDVCEKLKETFTTTQIEINGTLHDVTVEKRLIGDEYYQITNTPYFDAVADDVVYRKTKEFLTTIELNECGCPKRTQENLDAIRNHCYACYCQCYDNCNHRELDRGTYNILKNMGIIQIGTLDSDITHLYIEYDAGLPKENGDFVVPHLTFEPLVAFVKWKANEHKRSIPLQERMVLEQKYITEKKSMKKIMGKISFSELMKILRGLPTLEINMNTNCKGDGVRNFVNKEKQSSFVEGTNNTFNYITDFKNVVEDNW